VTLRNAVLGLVTAVAVGLLAAGCGLSGGNPSVAATVNNARIPVATLESRVATAKGSPQVSQQLAASGQRGQLLAQIRSRVLSGLIRSEVLAQGAEELGIEVTDTDIQQRRSRLVEQVGGQQAFQDLIRQNNLSQEEIRAQIRELVLQSKVRNALGRGQAQTGQGQTQQTRAYRQWLNQRVASAEVTVNPRFGRWDAQRGQVVASDPLGDVSESPSPGGRPTAPGGAQQAPRQQAPRQQAPRQQAPQQAPQQPVPPQPG
jgi:hypothetical protein